MIRLALLFACTAWGCGATCPQIRATERGLVTANPTALPHVSLRIPYRQANDLLSELIESDLEVPLPIPDELRLFAPALDAVSVVVREVAMRATRGDHAGFAITLAIRDRDTVVVTLELLADVVPRYQRDAEGAALVVGFDGNTLRSITPRLGPDAKPALARLLARGLPEGLRKRLPAAVLEEAADALVTHLGGAAYQALQKTLLTRLGEITRWQIRLPDVPIRGYALRSFADGGGGLEIDLVTSLPVASGLKDSWPAGADADVRVRFSGDTVAALFHWALEEGHLPTAYSRSLKPTPGGQHVPRLEWLERGSHPLKVHIFRLHKACEHLRLGFVPRLDVAAERLRVFLEDGRIEEAGGAPLFEIGVWIKSVASQPFEKSASASAHVQVSVGQTVLEAHIANASVHASEVEFGLTLSANQ